MYGIKWKLHLIKEINLLSYDVYQHAQYMDIHSLSHTIVGIRIKIYKKNKIKKIKTLFSYIFWILINIITFIN